MSSPRTKKFKSVPSSRIFILVLFWTFNGPIKHYQDHGQIINRL
jgi:hypothetical protein